MNIAPRLSEEEYKKNFEELISPFTNNSAVAEANRCLYCYDAPCTKACPTSIDVPTFIHQICSDSLKGSAITILSENIAFPHCYF